MPEGVEIVETYDRSDLIERAVDTLNRRLIEEFILVCLVCAVFLYHMRSSLVIVLSLPVGILAAFVVMNLQGINANIMSLGGIAIAIGTMVDAAIVMIENAHKHLERADAHERDRWEVIQEASLEVGPALFFSLLVVSLSFLPVFTLQAQEGRLFSPLAFTKTYAMAAAAILSITLVPVLMGIFIRGRIRHENENPLNRWLIAAYRPFIDLVLRKPGTVMLVGLLLVLTGLWPAMRLGSEFMPPLDEGDLLYMPSTFPGISVGKAQELLQQTDKMIRTVPEVKTVFGKIGRAETATDPAPLTMIETTIRLKPRDQWRPGMTMDRLKEELDDLVRIPGVTNAWLMPIEARLDMLATGIKTPVGVKIAGPDLEVIDRIGRQIEETIRNEVPGTLSVFSERVVGGRYAQVEIDRRRAARFGLNIADVQEIVRTAIGGQNVTETVEGRERFPVNIRYPREIRDSVEKLRALPVVTPGGEQISLGEVTHIEILDGPPMIKSENARPNGWVFIDIQGRDLGSYVAAARHEVREHVELPPGYSLSWSGRYEYMQRAKERLKLVVPLTLVVIVVLLYLSFRHIAEVAILLGTLPLAHGRRSVAAVRAGLQAVGRRGCRVHRHGRPGRGVRRGHADLPGSFAGPVAPRTRNPGPSAERRRSAPGRDRRCAAAAAPEDDDRLHDHRRPAAGDDRQRDGFGGHAPDRRPDGRRAGHLDDPDAGRPPGRISAMEGRPHAALGHPPAPPITEPSRPLPSFLWISPPSGNDISCN